MAGELHYTPWAFGTFRPLDYLNVWYATVEDGTLFTGGLVPPDTSALTGLTTDTLMRMLPYKGKMLVNDPAQGLAWTDGTIGGWAGCASPRVSKLIEGFNSTEVVSDWNDVSGSGTVSVSQLDVTEGRNTTKFKADVSSAWYTAKPFFRNINLTVFDAAPIGDGTTSLDSDYIAIRVTRSAKSDFTSCLLYLWTNFNTITNIGVSGYYVDLATTQDWISNPGSGTTFDFYIRKSGFTPVGTPSWTTVQAVEFRISSATGYAPYLICDNLRLEKSGPIARPLCRVIGDMESNETWTQSVATVSAETTYKKTLARSLKLNGSGASAYREFGTVAVPTLDLTSFDNGVVAATMDSIELYIARNDTKIAGTLRILFYYDATNYYYYDINASDSKGPKITTDLFRKLTDTGKCFTLISIRKDQFTSTGGAPTWSGINKVYLTSSAHVGAYYVDSIRLVRTKDKRLVVQFEPPDVVPTETITVTNSAFVAPGYKWADQRDEQGMIRNDEGSENSLHVKMTKNKTCTIDIALSAPIDCSTFDGGGASQDEDLIGPYFWFKNSKYVKNIDILYDVHDGTFNNYYIKSIPRDTIPKKTKFWFDARNQINEHLYVDTLGDAGTWATVHAVRIQVTTGAHGGCNFYVDQLIVTRADALSGTFYYRVRYQNSRGAKSEYSNISNSIELDSSMALLTSVPTSTGHIRLVERFSTLSNVWERVGIIDDDETTTFLDWLESPIVGQVGAEKTYDKPLIAKTFCIFKDVVVLGNLIGRDENTYISSISVGKEYSFEEFDPLDIFSLGADDGYRLLALVPYLDRVYAFKEKGIYSFDPYNLDQVPVLVSPDFGIFGEFAWAITDKGIAFLTQKKELYLTDGTSFTNIGRLTPNLGNVQSYLDAIPVTYISGIQMAYYDQHLLVAIPVAGETANSLVLCLYFPTQTWSVFTGWPARILHVANFSLLGTPLLMTNSSVYVYKLFDGNDDDGVPIVGTIQTPDWARDFTILRQPGTLFLTCKAISTNPTIQVTPYYDCTTGTALSTYTMASAVHNRIPEKNIPPAPSWATYLGLKFILTARSLIRGAAYTIQEETRQ